MSHAGLLREHFNRGIKRRKKASRHFDRPVFKIPTILVSKVSFATTGDADGQAHFRRAALRIRLSVDLP